MEEFLSRTDLSRRVRVEDVARVAGVSPITVSRTLSNPEIVRAETRERVQAAVAQTGYVVNAMASNLRSGRSSIISMFVSNMQNMHFTQAFQGCADALAGSGYHLLLAQTSFSDKVEADIVASILPMRPAAVVFTGVVQSPALRSALRDLGSPVMEMWDAVPDPIDMLVGFSNHEGGRLMGQHFAQQGFAHIAYVGSAMDRGARRLEGFRDGLAAGGASVSHVLPIEGNITMADGKLALQKVLEEFPQCDAIFFANDVLAAGAGLHAERLSRQIGRHIALAGYGDLDVSAELPVPMTTIHIASYDMGQRAGRMLLRRLRGEVIADRSVICGVRLEARESTSTNRLAPAAA